MADLSHIKLLRRGVAEWNRERGQSSPSPDLSHVEIRNAILTGADLRGCNLDGARLSNVDLRDARLEGARLNGVKVTRTSFLGASIQGVELKGADLTLVCFRGGVFKGTVGVDLKVRHSDLAGATFDDTELPMTHFYNCRLSGACFHRASFGRSLAKRVMIEPSKISELEAAGCTVELPNACREDEWLDWGRFDVVEEEEEFGLILYQGKAYWIAEGRWDFFVSHATVDKESVARPLAEALRDRGQRVWLDEITINAGDRLDEVIAFGIRSSIFGIVVVSPAFFGRRWTETELAALEQKRLFLVLHDMDAADLARVRPSLAERLALRAELGPTILADSILKAARQPGRDED